MSRKCGVGKIQLYSSLKNKLITLDVDCISIKHIKAKPMIDIVMTVDNFDDAKEFIRNLNSLIEQKISRGDSPSEKIILSEINYK